MPSPITAGTRGFDEASKDSKKGGGMKILVATSRGQGLRDNDFNFCQEGEPVRFCVVCDTEPDGPCGCRRALAGIESSKATTTFTVVDLPVTEDDYLVRIGEAMKRDGWVKDINDQSVAEIVRDLLNLADRFPTGVVVEWREDFQVRVWDSNC